MNISELKEFDVVVTEQDLIDSRNLLLENNLVSSNCPIALAAKRILNKRVTVDVGGYLYLFLYEKIFKGDDNSKHFLQNAYYRDIINNHTYKNFQSKCPMTFHFKRIN